MAIVFSAEYIIHSVRNNDWIRGQLIIPCSFHHDLQLLYLCSGKTLKLTFQFTDTFCSTLNVAFKQLL